MKKFWTIPIGLLMYLSLGCPGDPELKYDPIQGAIHNQDGEGIPDLKVYSSMEGALQTGRADSAATGPDGSYTISQGMPNSYNRASGCGNDPTYLEMRDFYVRIVHPDYDTSIVAFVVNRENTLIPDIIERADTVYVGDGVRYGAVGTTRQLPTVVLHPRNP